jgi:hypothetical protein
MSEAESLDQLVDRGSTFTTAQGNPVVHVRDTGGAVFLGILSIILLISLICSSERNRRLAQHIRQLETRH